MIILKSKPKRGVTTELIKRFIKDEDFATLISDNLTLYEIWSIIESLNSSGVEIVNREKKEIHTYSYGTNLYQAIEGEILGNIYITNSIPKDDFKDVQKYCKTYEDRNDITITITQQLLANEIIEGVHVIEI